MALLCERFVSRDMFFALFVSAAPDYIVCLSRPAWFRKTENDFGGHRSIICGRRRTDPIAVLRKELEIREELNPTIELELEPDQQVMFGEVANDCDRRPIDVQLGQQLPVVVVGPQSAG